MPMTNIEKDALLYAKTGKVAKLVECLASGFSPDLEGVLYYAAQRGHAEVIELLLTRGVDPNSKNQMDEEGSGPLHHSAYAGHLRIVEQLLARGADPNAKNREMGTALAYALERNHPEVARILKKVTDTRVSYSIDDALLLGDPVESYYKLHAAMIKDWHRGHSSAELRFLSLHAFSTFGLPNGIDDMLWQGGLWSITNGIELFEAIEELVCASFLRDGLTIIHEQCARSGLDLTPDLGQKLDFDDQTKPKVVELSKRLWNSGTAGYDDQRVFGKTMSFVVRNRSLYSPPATHSC
jgi:hypothetical protein